MFAEHQQPVLSFASSSGKVLCRFFVSYAAIASSAFLANTALPLVREVGRDIMSSAFVVLNLFYIV